MQVGEAWKGVGLWLGASLIGSITATACLDFILGSVWDKASSLIAVTSLIFTVGGSGFLILAFAWMGRRSLSVMIRYMALPLVGATAGALVMLPVGTAVSARLGCYYGFATGYSWVALHWLIYRGD